MTARVTAMCVHELCIFICIYFKHAWIQQNILVDSALVLYMLIVLLSSCWMYLIYVMYLSLCIYIYMSTCNVGKILVIILYVLQRNKTFCTCICFCCTYQIYYKNPEIFPVRIRYSTSWACLTLTSTCKNKINRKYNVFLT